MMIRTQRETGRAPHAFDEKIWVRSTEWRRTAMILLGFLLLMIGLGGEVAEAASDDDDSGGYAHQYDDRASPDRSRGTGRTATKPKASQKPERKAAKPTKKSKRRYRMKRTEIHRK